MAHTSEPAPSLATEPIRAAQYIRMSTDMQAYSPVNQREAIAQFAREHQMVIVRTYADEGKSGLTAVERRGLTELMADVTHGNADFQVVLVYDISRWGRFQDVDESAHYEYLCRHAGINVEYCMEAFRNDGSPMTAVIKSLKRVMAGEYSRELSDKVFRGQCRLAREGCLPGGRAAYGLRRMLVAPDGSVRGVLELGQLKYLSQDRTVLVPGPKEEQDVVRWVFAQVARGKEPLCAIARALNDKGIKYLGGRPWENRHIAAMVSNEKYIGNLIYNKTSLKLKQRTIHNPPDQWVRADGAFPAIVPLDLFRKAQRALERARNRTSDEQSLRLLRQLWTCKGKLNSTIINASKRVPSVDFYLLRFGSLVEAYRRIGFKPRRDCSYIQNYGDRYARARKLRDDVIWMCRAYGATASYDARTVVLINGTQHVAVKVCLPQHGAEPPKWLAQHHVTPDPEWLLVARLDASSSLLDYFLIPSPPNVVRLGGSRRDGFGPQMQSAQLGPLVAHIIGCDNIARAAAGVAFQAPASAQNAQCAQNQPLPVR